MGSDAKISNVAVAHGGISIEIRSDEGISAKCSFSWANHNCAKQYIASREEDAR